MREVACQVDFAVTQPRIVHCGLLQFLHQVLTFHEKVAQLRAEFLLMQLLDVFEFHARFRATASATLMPSTPADRIPPA